MPFILILEDNQDRREGFVKVLKTLAPDCEVRFWNNARLMVAESASYLEDTCLISLDHDLNEVDAAENPGDGLLIAEFLAGKNPVCPVVVHSSNYERSWSKVNEFKYAGWEIERVGPVCADWIDTLWKPVIAKLLSLKN